MNNKIMDRSLWDPDYPPFSKKTMIRNWKRDKYTMMIGLIVLILFFLYAIVF